jgi:mRNA-degrading endonuclease toxin of MazEF toxin-antitoxin module
MAGIERGGIYWVDPATPQRSQPGNRRPVLVVQSDGLRRVLDL